MDSLTQSKLPVIINIENLKPGTESWILACHKMRHALEEYGCFMVDSDMFSQDFKKEVYANIKTLFDLPSETKMKNISSKPLLGYFGPYRTRPLYESMRIENAANLDEVKSFANLMWPSGNGQFSETMHSYINLVAKLENLVRKMVFESHGVEKYCESFNGSVSYIFKVMKYKPPPSESKETGYVGFVTHTDKNFVTILSENQINGLEIQIKDDEWMAVEYHPSSFVVLAADAFMAWSNGRIKTPRHRVIMKAQEDRYSIGVFAFKKGIIETPEELVDEEHPRKFKAFDQSKFVEFYVKNQHYLDERALEIYCGNI